MEMFRLWTCLGVNFEPINSLLSCLIGHCHYLEETSLISQPGFTNPGSTLDLDVTFGVQTQLAALVIGDLSGLPTLPACSA